MKVKSLNFESAHAPTNSPIIFLHRMYSYYKFIMIELYIIEKRFILKQYNIILYCRLGFSTRARLYTVLWTLDSRKPPSSYPKRGPRNVIDVVFSERHRRWHFHSARVRDGRPRRLRAFYVRVNWFTEKRDRSDCLLMYDYYYRLGIFLRFVYESSCVSRPEYRMTSERDVGNFFSFLYTSWRINRYVIACLYRRWRVE